MADAETDAEAMAAGVAGDGHFEVLVPARDLHSWPVRTDAGEHLGHVRALHTDDDGHIVSLDVRERWILGPHHVVPAGGMRIVQGAVVVPNSAGHEMVERELEWRPSEEVRSSAAQREQPLPLFVQGNAGARRRFGGIDLVGSLLGALVVVAVVRLVGVLLQAATDPGALVVDTAASTFDAVTSDAMLGIAAAVAIGAFVGGVCAGRASRFDGEANGLLAVAWVLVLGLAFGALGAGFGTEWNAFDAAGLPTIASDSLAGWGLFGFAVLVVIALGCAALGGGVGEAWHRHADRAMLEVVQLAPGERHRPARRHRPHDGMP